MNESREAGVIGVAGKILTAILSLSAVATLSGAVLQSLKSEIDLVTDEKAFRHLMNAYDIGTWMKKCGGVVTVGSLLLWIILLIAMNWIKKRNRT